MFTAENCLDRMYEATYLMLDPGDTKIIYPRSLLSVCGVVTTGVETRTLEQPKKTGLIHTVVLDTDGGDLTLTVTGGYNANADTSITFGDAGDFVTFISIGIGTSFYWRVLSQGGTNVAVIIDTLTVENIVVAAEAAEHGEGAIGTAVDPATHRWTENGTIITEIKIDLTGLDSSGTENDVIGLLAGTPAYVGRNVVAVNGIIYRVEMSCIELPAGGDADIILVQGSAADEAFDDTVANTAVLCDGTGDWVASETIINNAPVITTNYYYYLTQGATDDATYTGGQVIIRTYGHALLS